MMRHANVRRSPAQRFDYRPIIFFPCSVRSPDLKAAPAAPQLTAERKEFHSSPTFGETKNAWNYTSAPSILHDMILD
jgi:hypothetical protein